MQEANPSLFDVRRRRLSCISACILWIGCLFLPALTFCSDERPLRGSDAAPIDFLAILDGQPSWFAHFFMFGTSVCLIIGRRADVVACAIGLLLALSCFILITIALPAGRPPVCAQGAGFYAWIAGIVFLFAAAAVDQWAQRRARRSKADV
jgi:uncharacterized membrane protein YphA (DoxX/SURF4 family)